MLSYTLKLYATLTDYLPNRELGGNQRSIKLEQQVSVHDVIVNLHLPEKLVHLVLLNGSYISPDQRMQLQLKNGDTLAIWPPVAGG